MIGPSATVSPRADSSRARLMGLVIAACLSTTSAASAATGTLVLPELVTGRLAKSVPNFVPPTLWIYQESGEAIPGPNDAGGWSPGARASVDEGWYLVEVGTERVPENRARVFVKAGQVTALPTGLVIAIVEEAEQQPPDTCPTWDAALSIRLPLGDSGGPVIAHNRLSDAGSRGAVQVLAGFYRLEWNRFTTTVEVRADHAYEIETGFANPMAASDYALFDVKERRAGIATMPLCRTRGTRLLSRKYWGTYTAKTQTPPFKERRWEEVVVPKPESRKGPYKAVRPSRIKGRTYTGDGAAPLMLWEVKKASQEAAEKPGDTPAPDSAEPTPDANDTTDATAKDGSTAKDGAAP